MNRQDFDYETARNEQIAERTEKHFTAKLADLVCGDPQLVAAVDDDLSHKLAVRETMAQLIVLAVTDARQAGEVLAGLIRDVLRDDAEVAAVKEVEQIEKQRAQLAAEDRADAHRFERMGA